MWKIAFSTGVILAGSAPVVADVNEHLGVLADAARSQIVSPWKSGEQDGWFVLQNAGDELEQAIVVPVGAPPAGGRDTSVNAMLLAEDLTASVGIFLTDPADDALCVMEVLGTGDGNFFCYRGDTFESIGSVKGVAHLDGSDVLILP
jgi:hypothetical protein